MGYYTSFRLEADPRHVRHFRETCEDAAAALGENGETTEARKWYECETDLAKLSKSFPAHLFTLHGTGEGDGDGVDTWRIYARGAETRRVEPKVVWPGPPFGWEPSPEEVAKRRALSESHEAEREELKLRHAAEVAGFEEAEETP